MASKLFIFAIGGTGSRVVKALTMLLASGVKLENTSELIPIIVDPHKANEDLKRTEQLLETYTKIRSLLEKNDNFFATRISTLQNAIDKNSKKDDTYTFELKGVSNETFANYIDFDNLDNGANAYKPNKDLMSLLFSKSNLATEMDIGFVGNPNIGSVVLNQFKDSDVFQKFASVFEPNDRIFIISSVFGGTGASGFPIILKNIRGAQAGEVQNPENLKNAKVGALTVMPYFGIEPNSEQRIDKATFYSKTKAAYHYYARSVNKDINSLYYLGDKVTKNYEYDPGENGQKNTASYIEIISAMAIVDFAATADTELKTTDGKPDKPLYSEFSIREDSDILNFAHLSGTTHQPIYKPLTQFTLLMLYAEYRLETAIGNIAWLKETPVINDGFMKCVFYRTHLSDFKRAYFEWLNEMAGNRRALHLFRMINDLAQVIIGYEPKKSLNPFGSKTEFPELDKEMNAYCKGKHFPDENNKFIQALANGTDKFLSEKFANAFK